MAASADYSFVLSVITTKCITDEDVFKEWLPFAGGQYSSLKIKPISLRSLFYTMKSRRRHKTIAFNCKFYLKSACMRKGILVQTKTD